MLNVDKLSKQFQVHIRDGKKIMSLTDVSFSLGEGEFMGLSGPSGIGKSSLLKCIYRTYLPTSGNIFYTAKSGETVNITNADEHTVLRLRKNEIGYISQFLHVIPRVSAIDIIAGALAGKGYDRKACREIAAEYLTRVKIPKALWEMYPSTFSGGEKQRLNIIHAMIWKPRLLLLDEPTASLDRGIKKEVIGLILDLKSEGTSMIGVFHDHDTMSMLADRELNLKAESCRELCV